MENKELQRIRMKEWWESMKKQGHWKEFDSYEKWEKRDESKEKKD